MGKFIQGAVKHKGSLKKWAAKHRLLNQDGTINLARAEAYARDNETGAARTHRLRQINLARTLESF